MFDEAGRGRRRDRCPVQASEVGAIRSITQFIAARPGAEDRGTAAACRCRPARSGLARSGRTGSYRGEFRRTRRQPHPPLPRARRIRGLAQRGLEAPPRRTLFTSPEHPPRPASHRSRMRCSAIWATCRDAPSRLSRFRSRASANSIRSSGSASLRKTETWRIEVMPKSEQVS